MQCFILGLCLFGFFFPKAWAFFFPVSCKFQCNVKSFQCKEGLHVLKLVLLPEEMLVKLCPIASYTSKLPKEGQGVLTQVLKLDLQGPEMGSALTFLTKTTNTAQVYISKINLSFSFIIQHLLL